MSDAPPTPSLESSSSGPRHFFVRFARPLLFVLGAIALVTLVWKIGALAVWHALVGAGGWLPLILLLDFSWIAIEGGAILILYGGASRSIPRLAWLEATLVHYATFMVVPMGRASAEFARAGLMTKHVGKSRAAASALLMQSFTLISNALLSLMCLAFVWLAARSVPLRGAIGLNVAITCILGIATYLLLRHVKLGGFMGRTFSKLSNAGPEIDKQIAESRRRHLPALLVCFSGRTLQTVQYGVIFLAVVGGVTMTDAFTAQGIQLVSRTLGDMVPNQVGVTETAFAAGAKALGLQGHIDKAVAIALLARLSNLSMAGLCALLVQLMPLLKNSRN